MLDPGTTAGTQRAAGTPRLVPAAPLRALELMRGRPDRARAPIPGFPRRIHLLGAGGAGVSGAARILLGHGHELSGHDRAASEHVALLRALGVEVEVSPQEHAHLPRGVELVIRSAAVPEDDPCAREARERGIAVLKYSEALGRLTPVGRTLAVAGTHGKTTTTWMLHHALRGLAAPGSAAPAPAPGAIVGGTCRVLGANAVCGEDGGWFAVEACEYDRSFLELAPAGAVVTNVEADHLDYYGNLEAIKAAFARFVDRIPLDGLVVLGPAVGRTVEQAARCATWKLGRELKLETLSERGGCFSFRLAGPGFEVPRVELQVPGRFNADNAACAIALAAGLAAREARIDPALAAAAAARGLEAFRGCARRFEPWGTVEGVQLVHDYAHHPTEVRVTLEAARRVFPGRPLHVLFQPHQHSRTARFLDEFVEALRAADRVVVADVYGARAHIDGEHLAGAPELAAKLAAAGVPTVAGGTLGASAAALCEDLPQECAVLVLGAGDVVDIKDDLFHRLAVRRAVRGGSRR
jgi:UDP-N-acetylmuramate--alanine ligase